MNVLAYINWGRWVADCPAVGCTNAVALDHGQPAIHCVTCRQVATVAWPDNVPDLERVLWQRPEPATRNWFPTDHPLAIASSLPHGQSVADLVRENEEHGVT